jgi:hypothetical protein
MYMTSARINTRLDAANRDYNERLREFQTLRLANEVRRSRPARHNYGVRAFAGYGLAVAAILAMILIAWLSFA